MSVTAALKANEEAIAEDAGRARVVFSTHGQLDGPTHVTLTSRRHQIEVDEPDVLAGGDRGANPVEYALASLASCQAITYRFWAAKLGYRELADAVDAHCPVLDLFTHATPVERRLAVAA